MVSACSFAPFFSIDKIPPVINVLRTLTSILYVFLSASGRAVNTSWSNSKEKYLPIVDARKRKSRLLGLTLAICALINAVTLSCPTRAGRSAATGAGERCFC